LWDVLLGLSMFDVDAVVLIGRSTTGLAGNRRDRYNECTHLSRKKVYMVAAHCKGGLGADWNEDRCSYHSD